MNHGATQAEWDHFNFELGLTHDLLPVVSNMEATISPQSKMKSLGKTPSRYNARKHAAGIAQWTQKSTTGEEIAEWMQEPDYGICIQTRTVRALDCDIQNTILAKEVHDEIQSFLKKVLPARVRTGSPKFLLAFKMPGDFAKRTIRTDDGIIEFLATGQQFIAAGTHQSGVRYEWRGGLPSEIPELAPRDFELLWTRLAECFAVEPPTTLASSSKQSKLTEAAQNDPVALRLADAGAVLSTERDGRIHIVCPFASEHTSDTDESATTYFPAFTGGFKRGHFHCLHAHCAERTDADFRNALGIESEAADDFDILPEVDEQPGAPGTASARYKFEQWSDFKNGQPPDWIIKSVVPRAALAVVFGESGSGKTFLAIDMALAIATGNAWRGFKVAPGRVAYIAAEDATGVRQRVAAYALRNDLPEGVAFGVLADSPNFTKGDDVKDVLKALKVFGKVDVVFVDTWAQVTPGANENSGEDMGKAMGYCRSLHRATGALIVLIHHSGKDSSKGARGWSGLRAAADCEIEVTRADDDRQAQVTKLKNAPDGAHFGFVLETVLLGEDSDGDDITSCVVKHTEAKKKTVTTPLTVPEQDVKAWFTELGGDTEQVEIAKLMAHAKQNRGVTRNTAQHVNRGIERLARRGYLTADDTYLRKITSE